MRCVMFGASIGQEHDSLVTTVSVSGSRAAGVKD